MKKSMTTEAKRFLKNASKLDDMVHLRTHSEMFGTVTLKKSAYQTKSGNRVYSVSGSSMIRNGSYGWAALKTAVMSTVA